MKNLADNGHNTVMTHPEVYEGPCQGPNYTPATSRNYVVLYFLTHFSPMLHEGTSLLICNAKQMTGFCIKCNNGLKRVMSHLDIMWERLEKVVMRAYEIM